MVRQRKLNIIAVGLLGMILLLITRYTVKWRLTLITRDNCDRVTAASRVGEPHSGDSAYTRRCLGGRESSEVCERLLRLGLSVIPEELQKECETIAEESPDWVELFKRFLSYVQWHKEVHFRIANNQTTMQETRTLTYSCDIFAWCTGLGATVKTIATGILVAMYTKRFFVADQLSYRGRSCWTDLAILSNAINWKVETPTWDYLVDKVRVSSHVVNASYNSDNAHVFYGNPTITIEQFFCKDLPEFERSFVTDTLCKEGRERNADKVLLGRKRTHFVLGAITRSAMHFSETVSEQTDQKLVALQRKGLASNGYVAVHLRTGMDEYSLNRGGKFRRSGKFTQDAAQWKKRIDCALHEADASGLGMPILLVTDSSECREWTRAQYKPKEVLVTDSSFFHLIRIGRHNRICDMEKASKMNNMVSEMDLISRASLIIPSTMSSFSEVAIYFSALPQSKLKQC